MPSDDAIRRRNRIRVLLVALLLVGGFAGWFYWKGRLRAAENRSDQEAAQSAPSNAATSDNSASRVASAGPVGTRATPDQSNNLASPEPPGTAESKSRERVFTIRIQAREDTWVNVTSDGKQVMDVVIPAGQERVIHARQELVLKTGNAAGIEVAHNGVPIGSFGAEKQIKTLTFNASGLAH